MKEFNTLKEAIKWLTDVVAEGLYFEQFNYDSSIIINGKNYSFCGIGCFTYLPEETHPQELEYYKGVEFFHRNDAIGFIPQGMKTDECWGLLIEITNCDYHQMMSELRLEYLDESKNLLNSLRTKLLAQNS